MPSSVPRWFELETGGNSTLQRLGQTCWADRICTGPCNFQGADLLCGLERHTLKHLWEYMPPSAVVLELGGRYGTVSCGISKRQSQSGLRLSLEPASQPFKSHMANVKANSCAGHTLLAAASKVPLYIHPGGGAGSNGNNLRTDSCPGCERRTTYRVRELASLLSSRVGRRVRFDSLVADCEGCFSALVRDEPEFLRDPRLKRIFYETDERDPELIRRVCAMGFGVVANQVDCLLPRGGLSQVVFVRGVAGCKVRSKRGVGCPDE